MAQNNMEVVAWRGRVCSSGTGYSSPWGYYRLDPTSFEVYDEVQALVTLTSAQAEIERLAKERDALREALKPFAEAAVDLDDDHKDGSDIWEASAAISVTAGHLRAARSALQPLEPKND